MMQHQQEPEGDAERVPSKSEPSEAPAQPQAVFQSPAQEPVWDGFTLPDPSESDDHWKRLETMARTASEELLAELPEDLRLVSEEVGIQIEVRPDSARGFRPNLLGVFLGLKREDARAGHSVIPPQICLFVENLWRQAGYNRERFRDEVRLTLYHELGHYLGLDEEDLIRRGIG